MKKIYSLFLAVFISAPLFSQKLEATPTQALLIVSVKNEKDVPQAGQEIFFESKLNKKIFSGITKENGSFEILVPKGDSYDIKYKTIANNADYTVLDVPKNEEELLSFDVIIQFAMPKKYTLDNVYFETGKALIKPSSYKYIDEMVEYMQLKKNIVIEISGHTDNVGAAATNLKLSQDRAEAVRAYLLKKGIAANRVVAKGYGDTQPIDNNLTDAGRQKNRRTEVKILSE
ncbi:MAG TPA: OmpA family protein [Bacteroidia bacterium]|nr:OmpA family protein [Bacteroidia bacterium]